MKCFFSVILSLVFLLQSFVTIQAMPMQENNSETECVIKNEITKKHTCCSIDSSEKEQSEKKNCCSGTSKMSCCEVIVALQPVEFSINFTDYSRALNLFGYSDTYSDYHSTIFHPPILA